MNLFYDLMMNPDAVHRFAKKKMKRISVVILAMTIGMSGFAQYKSHIGVDVGSMMMGNSVNLSAGYGFCGRWSVSWKVEIGTKMLDREYDSEYKDHIAELEDNAGTVSLPSGNSISIQYWPDSIYNGAWVETGCRCTYGRQADCMIGAGYMIPIWRGMKAVLAFQTDLLASLREDRSAGTGLTIGICWIITYGSHVYI